MIPSIRNALESQNSTEITSLDLRSDGPYPSTFSQVRPQRDLRSVGPHQQIAGKASQDAKKDFPRLVVMSSNQLNHQRENSVDSYRSDDENGYDTGKADFIKNQRKFQAVKFCDVLLLLLNVAEYFSSSTQFEAKYFQSVKNSNFHL